VSALLWRDGSATTIDEISPQPERARKSVAFGRSGFFLGAANFQSADSGLRRHASSGGGLQFPSTKKPPSRHFGSNEIFTRQLIRAWSRLRSAARRTARNRAGRRRPGVGGNRPVSSGLPPEKGGRPAGPPFTIFFPRSSQPEARQALGVLQARIDVPSPAPPSFGSRSSRASAAGLGAGARSARFSVRRASPKGRRLRFPPFGAAKTGALAKPPRAGLTGRGAGLGPRKSSEISDSSATRAKRRNHFHSARRGKSALVRPGGARERGNAGAPGARGTANACRKAREEETGRGGVHQGGASWRRTAGTRSHEHGLPGPSATRISASSTRMFAKTWSRKLERFAVGGARSSAADPSFSHEGRAPSRQAFPAKISRACSWTASGGVGRNRPPGRTCNLPFLQGRVFSFT